MGYSYRVNPSFFVYTLIYIVLGDGCWVMGVDVLLILECRGWCMEIIKIMVLLG